MQSQFTALMNLPMSAMLAHMIRTQIAQINAVRSILVLLRDDGSQDPRAAQIYHSLVGQAASSIATVFGDYINGRGEVAHALRTLHRGALAAQPALASLASANGFDIGTEKGMAGFIESQLPAFKEDANADLNGEWCSRVRVTMGAGFDGIWNIEALDAMRLEGKIPHHSKLPLESTGLFYVTDETASSSDEERYTYGLRIAVLNVNKTLLTMMSGEPELSAATYVPLEHVWAMHNDGRLTDISLIDGILDSYFAEIGLTDALPSQAVEAAVTDALAGLDEGKAGPSADEDDTTADPPDMDESVHDGERDTDDGRLQ
jgi:hypothetical protein